MFLLLNMCLVAMFCSKASAAISNKLRTTLKSTLTVVTCCNEFKTCNFEII